MPVSASRRRIRPADGALLVGCAVTVAVSMLFWTGVVPSGLYPPSPVIWAWEVPSCGPVGGVPPTVTHSFPLWSTAHVRWTAIGGAVIFEVLAREFIPIFQGGASGNGSFPSNGEAFQFSAYDPTPGDGPACRPILLNVTVTYTI
ncbi:MAG: hypothetical protein WBF81_02250 [Thermoplasmata archaeon]